MVPMTSSRPEVALIKDIRSLLTMEWKSYVDAAEAIVVHAPGVVNMNVLVGGDDAPLDKKDQRLVRVPVYVAKANTSEAIRIMTEATSCNFDSGTVRRLLNKLLEDGTIKQPDVVIQATAPSPVRELASRRSRSPSPSGPRNRSSPSPIPIPASTRHTTQPISSSPLKESSPIERYMMASREKNNPLATHAERVADQLSQKKLDKERRQALRKLKQDDDLSYALFQEKELELNNTNVDDGDSNSDGDA